MKLSREAILAMEPGRELDALVAEHVMGIEAWNARTGEKIPYTTNQYSAYISTAWEVVEKLSDQRLRIVLIDYQDSEWLCALKNKYGGYVEGEYKFNSAPEAICKIALLAVLNGGETE